MGAGLSLEGQVQCRLRYWGTCKALASFSRVRLYLELRASADVSGLE